MANHRANAGRWRSAVALLAIAIGILAAFPISVQTAFAASPNGRYIVTLVDSEKNPKASAGSLGKQYGLTVNQTYEVVIKGFAAAVPDKALSGLSKNPRVKSIEPDLTMSISATVPKGIDRVGADNVGGSGKPAGQGVTVAVLDTGVAAHPDLNLVGGYNCTTSDTTAYGDGHGHGTHVAGTIGANGTIIGVAPGTPILAVKVLDNTGSGSWSSILCGIDWVAGAGNNGVPRATVANMSLGGGSSENPSSCSSSSLHQALCNATAKGVTFAVAAGNSAIDASGFVPAMYPEVVTVAALADSDGCAGGLGGATGYGADDTLASFSNYGSIVDVAAPGVSIYSTVPGGYGTMSGTSMASPHVAGMLALGGYTTTSSGFGIPIAVVPNGDIACAGAAPNTTITDAPTTPTNSPSATFAFSATSPSTFSCKLDAGSWTPCGGPATTGTITFDALSDGSHTFSVRATANSATDATPAQATWVVDTSAPSGEITSPGLNAIVSATQKIVATASDGSGSGVASVQFQVRPAAGSFANLGSPDTSAPFEVVWDISAIPAGTYDIQALVTDNAGNTATTAVVSVTVAVAPNTSITAAPSGLVNVSAALIAFDATDPGATFECAIDGASWAPCVSPLQLTGLSEGSHAIQVRGINAAGADGTPASASWTVDTIAPTLVVTAPASINGSASVSAAVTDASTVGVVVFDVAPFGSDSFTEIGRDSSAPYAVTWNASALAAGSYSLRATATDAAGNTGRSTLVTVTVVVTPATIAVLPTSSKSNAKVSVTGSGFRPGETVVFWWDTVGGSRMGSAKADATGTVRATIKIPNRQPLGQHQVIAVGGTTGKQATTSLTII